VTLWGLGYRAGLCIKSFKQWLEASKIGKAPKFYKPTYISPFWLLKYLIKKIFPASCCTGFRRFFFPSLYTCQLPHIISPLLIIKIQNKNLFSSRLLLACWTGLNSIKSTRFLLAAAAQVLIAKDLFFSL
jgi:hypothetical protein